MGLHAGSVGDAIGWCAQRRIVVEWWSQQQLCVRPFRVADSKTTNICFIKYINNIDYDWHDEEEVSLLNTDASGVYEVSSTHAHL